MTHLGHDGAGGVARAEEEHVVRPRAHAQHALSGPDAVLSAKGMQHADDSLWPSNCGSGIQHALCMAEVRVSSPYIGIVSRV